MWIPVSNIWIQTEILNSFWKFCYAILIYLLLYLYFLHFRFKIDIVQYGGLLLIRTLKELRWKLLLLLLAFSRVNWGGDKLTTPGVKSKCVCVCVGGITLILNWHLMTTFPFWPCDFYPGLMMKPAYLIRQPQGYCFIKFG